MFKPKTRASLLKWHRRATILLTIQFGIWLLTALVMTLIPRSATLAYSFPAQAILSATAGWPDLTELSATFPEAHDVAVNTGGAVPKLTVDGTLVSPDTLDDPIFMPVGQMAAHAAKLTGEDIASDQVSVKTGNSPEYQKLPVPAFRVDAEKAVLFFDPIHGAFISQTPPGKYLENLMKTIHVMDYTGNGQFRSNIVLTFFAALFLAAAIAGLIAVKRLYVKHGGLKSMKVHQLLGLVLVLQVFFWVSSGLGVVWFLEAFRQDAEEMLSPSTEAIDWARVKVTPIDALPDDDPRGDPVDVKLTMLLGEPVYEIKWPGRWPEQDLIHAESGGRVKLTEDERDAIVAEVMPEDSVASIIRWEEVKGPEGIDRFFFTGPFPVWKGFFEEPTYGAIVVDQVTGHAHFPTILRQNLLAEYYNLHVVHWSRGEIKYRLEPELLIAIGLTMVLFGTGVWLQIRRWRIKGRFDW